MIDNYINHVGLVIDKSLSMTKHRAAVIKVVDGQIAHLAQRSQELNQETRVSIYVFADTVECLVFDKDVLRLPSIAELYKPNGNTALIDATIQCLDDLAKTAQMYGDHAFLEIAVTDGQENRARWRASELRGRLRNLPANWTAACLVPDQLGKDDAQAYGFPAQNIAIWDASGARGFEEAGAVIRQATDTFMNNRAKGVHSTTAFFSTGVDAVNASTVQAALEPLATSAYEVVPVGTDAYIELFVRSTGRTYRKGSAYYQLTKRELIQRHKKIAVREKTGARRVFAGPQARDLLGLRDADERVKPDYNPEFDVFVQSTSTNRKLIRGTELLLIH